MKLRKEIYLLCVLVSILIFFFIFVTYSATRFTLSIERVYESIEPMNVLSFEERYGVLFYVSKGEDSYILDVFVRNRIFPRFRHYSQHRYTNNFTTVVPGSRHYVLVILEYENMFFDEHNGVRIEQNYAYRIRFRHIIALMVLILATAKLLHDSYMKLRRC